MCLFEVGLVCSLPIENHVAAADLACPLSVHVVKVLNVSLQIILSSASLLDVLLFAERAHEGAFLLRGA